MALLVYGLYTLQLSRPNCFPQPVKFFLGFPSQCRNSQRLGHLFRTGDLPHGKPPAVDNGSCILWLRAGGRLAPFLPSNKTDIIEIDCPGQWRPSGRNQQPADAIQRQITPARGCSQRPEVDLNVIPPLLHNNFFMRLVVVVGLGYAEVSANGVVDTNGDCGDPLPVAINVEQQAIVAAPIL